jgi:DNA-binding transcriptional regulator PaaX
MNQISKDTTAAVVDGLLKFIAAGGFVTTGLIAPNAVQIFDKPVYKLLDKLDERSRGRELRRVAHYMKQQGLVKYAAWDYENGMQLTTAGGKRLQKITLAPLTISRPNRWDKKWRLVFFDIPEAAKQRRRSLTLHLRLLGFQQLQKSIWIHPFPCRSEIEALTESLNVRRFVSYVEISEIDGEAELRTRFTKILKN